MAWRSGVLAGLLAMLWAGGAAAADDSAAAAQALRSRQAALQPQLKNNAFGLPLVLESTEGERDLSGDVYALLPQPLAAVSAALKRPAQWCDVLMLHLNVKHCETTPSGLALNVGSKHDQPLEQTSRLELIHRVTADTPDYLRVQMTAEQGPLGTRSYRIVLELTPAEGGLSFVHFRYAYGYGIAAHIAIQAYVRTVGRDKVGFSPATPGDAAGGPRVGGVRGAVERNTMRYYLAIVSYLESLALPAGERVERRLRDWFAATERYPLQLHELERDEYLEMKRGELRASPAQ